MSEQQRPTFGDDPLQDMPHFVPPHFVPAGNGFIPVDMDRIDPQTLARAYEEARRSTIPEGSSIDMIALPRQMEEARRRAGWERRFTHDSPIDTEEYLRLLRARARRHTIPGGIGVPSEFPTTIHVYDASNRVQEQQLKEAKSYSETGRVEGPDGITLIELPSYEDMLLVCKRCLEALTTSNEYSSPVFYYNSPSGLYGRYWLYLSGSQMPITDTPGITRLSVRVFSKDLLDRLMVIKYVIGTPCLGNSIRIGSLETDVKSVRGLFQAHNVNLGPCSDEQGENGLQIDMSSGGVIGIPLVAGDNQEEAAITLYLLFRDMSKYLKIKYLTCLRIFSRMRELFEERSVSVDLERLLRTEPPGEAPFNSILESDKVTIRRNDAKTTVDGARRYSMEGNESGWVPYTSVPLQSADNDMP